MSNIEQFLSLIADALENGIQGRVLDLAHAALSCLIEIRNRMGQVSVMGGDSVVSAMDGETSALYRIAGSLNQAPQALSSMDASASGISGSFARAILEKAIRQLLKDVDWTELLKTAVSCIQLGKWDMMIDLLLGGTKR